MRRSQINRENAGIPTDSPIKPIMPPRQRATRAWYDGERDDVPEEKPAPKREAGRREAAVARTKEEQELALVQVESVPPRALTQKAHSTKPAMPEMNRTATRRSLEERPILPTAPVDDPDFEREENIDFTASLKESSVVPETPTPEQVVSAVEAEEDPAEEGEQLAAPKKMPKESTPDEEQ